VCSNMTESRSKSFIANFCDLCDLNTSQGGLHTCYLASHYIRFSYDYPPTGAASLPK
jgi:hypothetical protein